MKRFAFFFLLILIGCDRNETEIESVNNFDGDNLNFEMPQQVISKMTRGINIGNTLEPPQVGDWNNEYISEYFFDDYVEAGFNTVRVPIRWDKHTLVDSPYTVSETWLDTVEQVIDWGLSKDLYLIINAHHDWWLVNNMIQPRCAIVFMLYGIRSQTGLKLNLQSYYLRLLMNRTA